MRVLLQVLNLTELELNRVDIRVGLSGALYYMDGSPQAVRQLRNLVSQVLFLPLQCIKLFFSLLLLVEEAAASFVSLSQKRSIEELVENTIS